MRWSLKVLISRYRRQSSANRWTWELTEEGRSLIWQRRRVGPRTVPWETPESMVVDSEQAPSMTTLMDLCVHQPGVEWTSDTIKRKFVEELLVWDSIEGSGVKNRYIRLDSLSNQLQKSKAVVSSWVSHENPERKLRFSFWLHKLQWSFNYTGSLTPVTGWD